MPEPGPGLYRMIALAPVMCAATAYRAGVGYANAWYSRAPRLASLWLDAIEPRRDAPAAGGELREEVLQLAKESLEAAYQEVSRGIDDLGEFSRPPTEDGRAAAPGG
jgi:hypothetical protein